MSTAAGFRRPALEEAEVLARLHLRCWREAYAGIVPEEVLAAAELSQRVAAWQRSLADPQRVVIAAYDGPEPVGFIIAGPSPETFLEAADGQVAALYVLASHQRRGLGRRLLASAAQGWLAQGGTMLALGVLADNHRARAFYQAMGGRIVRTGTYSWEGHELADAIYVFDNLAELARLA
ncbi:MAG: GNAT family N-acetyltransferase [Rhizobiales bacterium]|nr:GNAT family N-acetyltransferase [Hyphomicrobiales bacterium]MBI3674821.1 GNAT family N-acetyltransferase [Hyphomicrobiales bacterium]